MMMMFKGAQVGDFVAVLRHGHPPRKAVIEAITWTQVTVEGVKYGVAAGAAMVGACSHSRLTPWTKEIEEALLAESEEFRRSERRVIAITSFYRAVDRVRDREWDVASGICDALDEGQVIKLEEMTSRVNIDLDTILGGGK